MPPLTTAVNPRQPLAVTSINAILNNPIPSEPTGKPIVSVKPVVTAAVPCQKRKASEVEDVSTENAPEIHPNDPRLHHIDQNCDQIRRKINTLLNSGEMKVGEFIKTINVNSKSYGSFMKLSGPTKGSANGTYSGAFAFFKRRELMGFKAPKKARVSREVERGLLDVSMVKLEGEEDMEVPVYETCDSIRRQITAFLREPGITQAAFLREIAKSFPDGRKDPQSKVLKDFLGKSGAKAGNTSAIFYGSYVFFEKMRIRDGKPKSKFREEMEMIYAGGDGSSDEDEGPPGRRVRKGIDIKRAGNGKFWCMQGERPTEDQYGRVSFRRV